MTSERVSRWGVDGERDGDSRTTFCCEMLMESSLSPSSDADSSESLVAEPESVSDDESDFESELPDSSFLSSSSEELSE